MSRIKVILCATAFLASAIAQADELVVIKAGSLFDSRSGKVTRNALIFVDGERIVGVENAKFEERADGVADGPWAVRQQVRRNVKYGADLTKFCATGGVFSKGTKPGMTQYTL